MITLTHHFAYLFADALEGTAADPATWRAPANIAVAWIDHLQPPRPRRA
jgi:hypothetical protein